MKKKLVIYIAHPLGADEAREANRARASRWVAWAALHHSVAPVATWITLAGEWSECAELRYRGLDIDCALIERCDEVWLVGGRISPGMQIEADLDLAGSLTSVRERVGNAIPEGTATAIGVQMLCTLANADAGRFALGSTDVWVEREELTHGA